MSISNIEATKYFDEVRSYFGPQTQPGRSIDLVVQSGRNWENQIGSGELFHIVNQALLAFADQKKEWSLASFEFTLKDASEFLVDFMKQVSSFLR